MSRAMSREGAQAYLVRLPEPHVDDEGIMLMFLVWLSRMYCSASSRSCCSRARICGWGGRGWRGLWLRRGWRSSRLRAVLEVNALKAEMARHVSMRWLAVFYGIGMRCCRIRMHL